MLTLHRAVNKKYVLSTKDCSIYLISNVGMFRIAQRYDSDVALGHNISSRLLAAFVCLDMRSVCITVFSILTCVLSCGHYASQELLAKCLSLQRYNM